MIGSVNNGLLSLGDYFESLTGLFFSPIRLRTEIHRYPRPMFKSGAFLLASIFLLHILPSTAYARSAAAPMIGTIDLATVLVFHPAMATFDPYKKAFRKTDAQVFPQDKERLARESREAIEKHRENIRLIEGRMSEARLRNSRETAELTKKFLENIQTAATPTVDLHRQAHRQKMSALSQKHTAQIRAFQIQKEQIQRLIDQSTAMADSHQYTMPAEAAQRFAAILSEIQRFTKQIAEAKGIGIVLDSGGGTLQAMRFTPKSEILPPELDYANILASKPPAQIMNDQAAVDGLYSIQRDYAAMWHQYRGEILSNFRNQLLPSAVVVGGVDLTQEVLAALLNQYRINRNIQMQILSVAAGK